MRDKDSKREEDKDSGVRVQTSEKYREDNEPASDRIARGKEAFGGGERPITARVIEASPTNGERKTLSSVVLQEKSGRKATLIFSMKPLMVRGQGEEQLCDNAWVDENGDNEGGQVLSKMIKL